jgi:hypothetical protein
MPKRSLDIEMFIRAKLSIENVVPDFDIWGAGSKKFREDRLR